MLRSMAEYSMRGRWQAAIVITLLSLAAVMLPPLSYLASGVIALCTLRMGPKEGVTVVVATTVIFTLFAGLLLDQLLIAGLFLLSSWLPVLAVSLVLGYTRSLAVSILTAGGLGILVVLGFYIVLPDPVVWWQQVIAPFMETLGQQPEWQLDQTQTQELISSLSGVMTGFIAASFSLNIILGLFIGRAWQAKLYNAGGFASEFDQLRLSKSAAIVTVVLMVISISPLSEGLALLQDCLPVVMMVFALQGLSVVHAIIRKKQKQTFWLVAVYVMLIVMMPQMVTILAMIGVLEQWFNFRRISVE